LIEECRSIAGVSVIRAAAAAAAAAASTGMRHGAVSSHLGGGDGAISIRQPAAELSQTV